MMIAVGEAWPGGWPPLFVSWDGVTRVGYIDKNGSALVALANADGLAVGGLGNPLVSLVVPGNGGPVRMSGRHGTRRKVQLWQLLSIAGNFPASAWQYSNALSLADYSEALVLCSVLNGGASTPAGLKIVLQVGDMVNGLWMDHPSGQVALTATATGGQGAAGYSNIGDFVRVGVFASAVWVPGATVQLWLKVKG